MEGKNKKTTVLITGGSRKSIGRFIAIHLAKTSFVQHIIIHYHESVAEAQELAAKIMHIGTKCSLYQADFRQPNAGQQLIDTMNNDRITVDILINNAGIIKLDTALTKNMYASLSTNMLINCYAPIQLAAAFSTQKYLYRGSIINILDHDIMKTSPYFSYNISKSALWQATKQQARAFAPNVRVNAIAPYMVTKHIRQKTQKFTTLASNNPLQYAVQLTDICDAIDYLIQAQAITGNVIFLDGGKHLI